MRGILLVLLLVCVPFGAAAQDRSAVFTVPMVPVFAEAENAARAQSLAQDRGRREAMDILLRRLTASEDWAYLPRLAAGQAAPAAGGVAEMDPDIAGGLTVKQPVQVTPDDLARVELSFAPFGEKTSATTYRAQVTYRFSPEAVRRLLQDARLPYSEQQTRRALILPILETDQGLYLWEAKNPWARAWLARPLVNELTPLVLPRGDEQDVQAVTAAEARAFDQTALRALATRYGVPQVIVALGQLQEEAGEQRLTVRLLDGYLDGRSDARRRIDAGSSAELYGEAVSAQTAGRPGAALASSFFRAAEGDFPRLARRAVEGTVAGYANEWKAQTLVDHSAQRRFQLTAWFDGLDDWAEIRTALEDTALVTDMQTGAFTNENAVIVVTAIGTAPQFELAMRQSGLDVWRARESWHIAGLARAARLKERFVPVSAGEANRLDTAPDGTNEPGQASGRDRRFFGFGEREEPRARRGDDGEAPDLPDDLFGETPEPLTPDADDAESEGQDDPFGGVY